MKIIEVRLREQGKIANFNTNNIEVKPHSIVIVESERGVDYGHVISEAERASVEKTKGGLKPVVRLATAQDIEQIAKNKQAVKDVFSTAQKKIQERKLSMKLVAAEYSFDRSKVIFYFTADIFMIL